MTKNISFFSLSLGCLFLGLTLILPSGIIAWFDGLPWTGEAETLIIAVIIPFLLILGWRFLSLRLSILFLGILLVLKIILFFGSPSSGWLVKIKPNITKELLRNFNEMRWYKTQEAATKIDVDAYLFPGPDINTWIKNYTSKGDYWVKTYSTFWNKNSSGILRKPWTEKLDFPLDWVLIDKPYTCSVVQCFDQLSPIVEIEGSLMLPEGESFALVAEGAQEGTFSAMSESGERFIVSPAKNLKEATEKKYQLPSGGKWRISGSFLYKGITWSLLPILVKSNGEITRNMGRGALWQNWEDLFNSQNQVGFYKTLSFILDGGIIIFLLVWIAWVVHTLVHQKVLNRSLIIFSSLAAGATFLMAPIYISLFNLVGLADPRKTSHLGISVTVAAIGFLVLIFWKKDYQSFQTDRIARIIPLLFGPATLIFFANKWWPALGQWQMWIPANDWISYQFYANRIIVDGDWLHAGQGNPGYFYHHPFYSYMIGVYHWLFGQSSFVQHMADVWCVLGATILLAKLMEKLRLSAHVIFIGCTTYLAINFIGAFRYLIGNGLMEQHAMIFMMLSAWYLCLAREGGAFRIFMATIFGIIAFWTRMDHLVVIACLGLLLFEPIEGPTDGWKGYWDRFRLHWKRLAWYWGGGILSILLLCFRNWWIGGYFIPTQRLMSYGTKHEETLHSGILPAARSMFTVITGRSGGDWFSLPSISGLIVMFSVLAALLALVWRHRAFLNFPLSLSISIVGLLLPYIFMETLGYPPRFSVHLLPLAILSLMFISNNLFYKYKALIKC